MEKYNKILGYILILGAIIILILLPTMVYPKPSEEGIDIYLYILETSLNITRYAILSIFAFTLGIKYAFKR